MDGAEVKRLGGFETAQARHPAHSIRTQKPRSTLVGTRLVDGPSTVQHLRSIAALRQAPKTPGYGTRQTSRAIRYMNYTLEKAF